MRLFLAILILLVTSAALALPPAVSQAALADRATLSPEQQISARYLWIPAAEEDLAPLGAVLKFAVCSTSREPNLDRQLPVEVAPDLYRIDLAALGWDVSQYYAVVAKHPYHEVGVKNPLVVHAGWFLQQISDATESDAYYRLIYGTKQPKTRQEFLAFWGVDPAKLQAKSRELSIWIEGKSGVSVQGIRTMLAWPSETGALWETRDVLDLSPAKDPLAFAGKDAPYDGQEWIIPVPKISYANQTRGVAQVYWLTDGKDKRVEIAPTTLVEDHTRARGVADIITPMSCITCHGPGLNEPSVNEFRRIVEAGVKVLPYDDANADRLQRLMFPVATLIKRQNEDYAAFVRACNSMDGESNARAYRLALKQYRDAVTIQQAAHELGCTPEELTLALSEIGDVGVKLGVRLAALGTGDSVPRDTWEAQYQAAASYLAAFRKSVK